MSPSIWQILIVVALLLLLFGGRGKISSIMGDLAGGIRSFKKGLNEDEEDKDSSKTQPHAIPDRGQTIDMSASNKDEAKTRS